MHLVTASRIVALLVSVPTFLYLFPNDGFRSDNLFLVPDLILCALLALGAALPARHAVPLLTFAFGLSAGVITTAVSSYAVRGEFAFLTFAAALASVVTAWLLARHGAAATAAARRPLDVPVPVP
ncbi:hypothetical protein [Streptomyces sp. MP131-18]|uniref:hypothetical protein n=1 Tax=Streptomyces sp. MP131-18 TaxID=1857892 RepID=UPI00097C7927|nr:hypothetical protein [Streptomyces sp. MP131-18]ONK13509.1 hypothetical protein STBA_42780 [Streptomyces sp. MP131-18]